MEMLYDVLEVYRRVWDLPRIVLEQCGMDMTSNGEEERSAEKKRAAMGNEKNRIVKIGEGIAL